MAADVSIKQCTGVLPSITTITNLRLNADDTANPGVNNPIAQPAAGTNRSFAKTVYLNADTSPSGRINNVKLYCDGDIDWHGCTLYVGQSAVYTPASGVVGNSGDDSAVAVVNIENYTSSNPLSIPGSIENPNTGRITNYIVFQLDLLHAAHAGTLPAETLTLTYDEF